MADNAKWYVIHTYSGYENAVKAAIEKSVVNRNMSDMVLKMEIPMETVTEVTESGVMKEVERKVFPGYVLIKMILTDDTWHLIRNIRGVTGFVGEANKAIPLTEEEVTALGVEKHEIVVLYNVGDTVKITDGPFTSFTISCFSTPRAATSSSVRGMALLASPTKPVTPRMLRIRCQVSSVRIILIRT